jgi:predicted dehydrogenase
MISSRRHFLKSSAALSVPLILPFSLKGETANNKVVMGFIGMGKQSHGLLSNFIEQDDVHVAAVCDVDTTRREHAQKVVNDHYTAKQKSEYTGCDAYNDFRKIIEREDINAVCIATPDHWHAIPTIAALRSGKDVYCEKPLTHNIHEAIEVIQEVDKNKRVLQTGSMQRSSKEFRVACELVANNVIGKISKVECSFGDPGIACDLETEEMEPGLDWDMWCGPGPKRGYSSVLSPRGNHTHYPKWRTYKEYGGGMVCDWGAHHLDIAQWGLGMDGSGPVKITAPEVGNRGAVLHYADGVEVIHKDGFGVHFFGESGEVKVNRRRFEMIKDGEVFAKWTNKQDSGSLFGALAKAEKEFLNDKKVALYQSSHHIQDFLECVRKRTKPITNEIVGAGSAICCHLMNQAYYNRTAIHWDPAKKTFAKGGDPAWLTRDYRSPWKV